MSNVDSVKVAVRVRPMSVAEQNRGCKTIVEQAAPNQPQLLMCGGGQSSDVFTYNHVFPPETSQAHVYECAVSELLGKLFEGYNVTIMAYGQTSSGKTYTMGTDFAGELNEQVGVIPRAVSDIFRAMENKPDGGLSATCSFIELYQDNVFDLLAQKPGTERQVVDIRETAGGSIVLQGLTEVPVATVGSTFDCLVRGSSGRSVRATAMNNVSSRSHAIFTLNITSPSADGSAMTRSKFHLVDLAGSERANKTATTGDRFKEGVQINKCLLALGNVITALGAASVSGTGRGFIPYRSSKLTRLLQDSLGGNSYTLMIACVSPSDYNLSETYSTLRYACRVCQIKNKPVVNQDPQQALVKRLEATIQDLRLEILSLKSGHDGGGSPNDGFKIPLPVRPSLTRGLSATDMHSARKQTDAACNAGQDGVALKKLQDTNRKLQSQLQDALHDLATKEMRTMVAEKLLDDIEKLLAVDHGEPVDAIDEQDEGIHVGTGDGQLRREIIALFDANREERITLGIAHGSILGESQRASSVGLESAEIERKSESHTQQQMRIHNELNQLTRELALKEELHRKCMGNSTAVRTLTSARERDLSEKLEEYEGMIHGLEAQINELNTLLENTKASEKRSKLSEERRRKVQQLEAEVGELRQRSVRQAKLLKLKEKDAQRIEGLSAEIQTMKATRVKLLKSMRAESENFRQWRTNREREIGQLRAKDRKRQVELQKLESTYTLQRRVMQRKMDETILVNKRLKATLDRRQRRLGAGGSDRSVQLRGPNALQWIEHELELMHSTIDATVTLQMLLRQRTQQTAKLAQLRAGDGGDPADLDEEIRQCETDLDYRNAQIADLQLKIHTNDTDSQLVAFSEGLAALTEPREAFRRLLEQHVRAHTRLVEARFETVELQATNECQQEALAQSRTQLDAAEQRYNEQVTQLERTYEDKLSLLLMQRVGPVPAGDTSNGGTAQDDVAEEAFGRIAKLRDELELYRASNRALQDRLAEATKRPNARARKLPRRYLQAETEPEFAEDTEASLTDDENDRMELARDPDFRGTPQYKRKKSSSIRESVLSSSVANSTFTNASIVSIGAPSTSHTSCNCTGNCATKRCGCQKHGTVCRAGCKCPPDCANRPLSTVDESPDTNAIEGSEGKDGPTPNGKENRSSIMTPHKLGPMDDGTGQVDILTYVAMHRKRKPLIDL